jgi:four helix bundle protein
MDKIERFEDILAWQKARALTKRIYCHTKQAPFCKDFGLKGQIQRASVSTMANIAEGFERGGDKEFVQFLSNAKGSCGEVRSHLYVALDQNYLTSGDFNLLYGQSAEIGRLISGFMTYLRESDLRGHKYR